MYESLKNQSTNFHLYIFAFDQKSFSILKKLNLKLTTIISLKEFEDEQLLAVKGDRTSGEYCWTCTPSIIKYSIEKFGLENCTYLDADLYFFNDPSVLIKEMKDKSVLITEHRYTKKYDTSSVSGIYCVQFMTFVNNNNGLKVLNWWRDACIDWCYARTEDGKFGDQKYLDDWTTRFKGVHVLQDLGGGVAPWNIQQYDLTDNSFELIFYHFHNFKFLEQNKIDLGGYELDKNDIDILYKPYARHIDKISVELKILDKHGDYNGVIESNLFYWKTPFRILRRKLNGSYNIIHKNKLLDK